MKVGEGYALLKSTVLLILFLAMSGWPLDVLRDTACARLGYDARAKVETCEARGRGVGDQAERRNNTKWKKEERLRGGEWLESQRGRQPIRLGDDSPTLDIYSIRREGGTWRRGEPVGGRANGLGGVQDNITVPVDREWRWRDRPQWRKNKGRGVNETGRNRQMTGWRWRWEGATEIEKPFSEKEHI